MEATAGKGVMGAVRERKSTEKVVERETEGRKRWESKQETASTEKGINRQEPERQVQEAKVRTEQRGCGRNFKVSDEDERIEVEPDWQGGNETKQGRQKKRESKDENSKWGQTSMNADRMVEAGVKNYRLRSYWKVQRFEKGLR